MVTLASNLYRSIAWLLRSHVQILRHAFSRTVNIPSSARLLEQASLLDIAYDCGDFAKYLSAHKNYSYIVAI